MLFIQTDTVFSANIGGIKKNPVTIRSKKRTAGNYISESWLEKALFIGGNFIRQ